jgi:hypothetical protein
VTRPSEDGSRGRGAGSVGSVDACNGGGGGGVMCVVESDIRGIFMWQEWHSMATAAVVASPLPELSRLSRSQIEKPPQSWEREEKTSATA